MSKKHIGLTTTNTKSMIVQKTNEDFNKEKPDRKDDFFKEGNKTATGINIENAGHEIAEIKTFTCSKHPEIKSDKPGKCPICGMLLIKKT